MFPSLCEQEVRVSWNPWLKGRALGLLIIIVSIIIPFSGIMPFPGLAAVGQVGHGIQIQSLRFKAIDLPS